jgi:hypothetical protein
VPEQIHNCEQHRIEAIRRDPRVSVVVTSTGTKLGAPKTITVKGRVQRGDPAESKAFAEFLDSPLRVILEVTPEKWITYDGAKVALDSAGKLPPEKKTKPASSDTERLAVELKRGMA